MFLLVSIILIFSSCCGDGTGTLLVGAILGGGSYEPVDESDLLLNEDFIWRNKNTAVTVMSELNSYFCKDNYFSLRNVEDDKIIWANQDLVNFPNKDNSYFGENFIVSNFSDGHTIIEIATGDIIYQKDLTPVGYKTSPKKITGIGDLFFQVGTTSFPNNQFQDVVLQGNINASSRLETILKPNFQTDIFDQYIGIGTIGEIQSFETANGDIMLALTYAEPTAGNEVEISFGLWNMNTEEWIYERIHFMNYFGKANLHIDEDKLYCYNSLKLACYNLNDGSLIWEKETETTAVSPQFLDEFIVIENGNLEILNNENGEIITIHQSTIFDFAASSKFVYIPLDELKIFDIETSKIIKTIETPYINYPKEIPGYFKHLSDLTVVEDKENGIDHIFISLNGYNFKMEMEH